MWHYNGEDDASRCGRKGPDNFAALAAMLADLFKGEKEDFTRLKCREGFSMYNPIDWVSFFNYWPYSTFFQSHASQI